MKIAIQSLTLSLSLALLVACGTKSAPERAARNAVAKPSASTATTTIQVTNAESFEKIHEDENGKAAFVAVEGQIVESAALVQADPTGKKVRCVTRLHDVRAQDGQTFDQVTVQYTPAANQPNLYYATLSRVDMQAQQGFAIDCMKIDAAVTAAEVKAALKGIVEVSL